MTLRVVAAVFVIGIIVLAYGAWHKKETPAAPPPPAAAVPFDTTGGALPPGHPGMEAIDPGIAWTVPATWTAQEERPMRVATYAIPAASGDAEGAECAVFHFGPNQGGGVDDNIRRWVDQFENPSKPKRSGKKIHGFQVDRVEVTGTYLAPGGPMMESQGSKPGYMLLGAIVGGPHGSVFFKLTGPVKTVQAASKDFDGMLQSLRGSGAL